MRVLQLSNRANAFTVLSVPESNDSAFSAASSSHASAVNANSSGSNSSQAMSDAVPSKKRVRESTDNDHEGDSKMTASSEEV